jgi:hypothetical protein
MYPDDDFLPEEALKASEPTQAELDDYHEDVKIEAVLSGFVRLCSEYGFYFMMRQLTKALNAKGFNV